MQRSQPVFNAPGVVLGIIAILVVMHAVLEVLSDAWAEWLVLVLAFIPARYSGEAYPGGSIATLTSFGSHMLVHGDWMHLILNCAWMLAFGTIVARRIGGARFLALGLLTGIAGAALFLALNIGLRAPMVGISGAVSGLMGAAMRFIFRPTTGLDGEQSPLMTFRELLSDRRAMTWIVIWVAMNLVFGLLLGTMLSVGGIAWEAHLGGFAAGLVLIGWLDRPGRVAEFATQPDIQ